MAAKRTIKGMKNGVSVVALEGINFDGAGSAEVLPIEKINVDPDYQRSLRHDLIERIRKEWDIVKAGPILVSQRTDGSLWCVDGQHRMLGAQGAGETEIFANVIHGLTPEEEAALRLARNDRKPDTIGEKFKTRLVMGDPVAHRMVEIARQFHTQINTEPNMHSGINAIGAVEMLYKLDDGSTLISVLNTLKDAFGTEELHGRVVSVAMLKGTAWFLNRHIGREVPRKDFIQRLREVDMNDIDRKARTTKAALGGSMWINYYRAMVEIWNFRRTEKQRIDWVIQGSLSTLGGDSEPPRDRRTAFLVRERGDT